MHPDPQRMQSEIEGVSSVSDRIRALDRAGYRRADIARFLGKRYQQVRNVLVGDQQVGRSPKIGETEASANRSEPEVRSGSEKVRIGPNGQIEIPARFREALGLKDRDVLFARLEDGEIKLLTPLAAMRRAQAMVRKFVPEGVSLVDEFLADRRQEVEREKYRG
jgi:AbrB family looped-hinge helix DNA binding protein